MKEGAASGAPTIPGGRQPPHNMRSPEGAAHPYGPALKGRSARAFPLTPSALARAAAPATRRSRRRSGR